MDGATCYYCRKSPCQCIPTSMPGETSAEITQNEILGALSRIADSMEIIASTLAILVPMNESGKEDG